MTDETDYCAVESNRIREAMSDVADVAEETRLPEELEEELDDCFSTIRQELYTFNTPIQIHDRDGDFQVTVQQTTDDD